MSKRIWRLQTSSSSSVSGPTYIVLYQFSCIEASFSPMLNKNLTFGKKGNSGLQNGMAEDYEGFGYQRRPTIIGTSKLLLSDFLAKSLSFDGTIDPDDCNAAESIIESSDVSIPAATSSMGDSSYASSKSSTSYEEIYVGPPVLPPYDDAEEEFLEEYESYFMHLSVDNVRKDQYPMLEQRELVYLDYVTCPLYSIVQVERHMKFLLKEVESYIGSDFIIDKQYAPQNGYIRSTYEHILNILNTTAEEYSIIFTPDLSAAYNLFVEMYHLPKGSLVLGSHDHENFVSCMVHSSAQSYVKVGGIPLKKKDFCVNGKDMHNLLRRQGWSGHGCGLLVMPAQSFSTGICYSLNWVVGAQQNGWKVLLDVSCGLPVVNVDLSLCQPDFLIGSLHQVLGYPSDIGFLLVRRSTRSICMDKGSSRLRFAEIPENGQAVHVIASRERLKIHTYAALNFGFEHLESIGIVAIQNRARSLFSWLVKTLNSLKHKSNGKHLLQLYGSLDPKHRGSILAFNILDSTGSIFPAKLVRQLAERSNILLGISRLLNQNIADCSVNQTDTSILYGSVCSVEVVCISLGIVSTFSDVYRLAQFLSRFRDEDYMSSEADGYAKDLAYQCCY